MTPPCSIGTSVSPARVGLRGTPLLIAGDGRLSEGAKPATELEAWLNAGESQDRAANAIPNRREDPMTSIAISPLSGCAPHAGYAVVYMSVLVACRLRQHGWRRGQRGVRLQGARGREVRLGVGHLLQRPAAELALATEERARDAGRVGRTDAHGSAPREPRCARRLFEQECASYERGRDRARSHAGGQRAAAFAAACAATVDQSLGKTATAISTAKAMSTSRSMRAAGSSTITAPRHERLTPRSGHRVQ